MHSSTGACPAGVLPTTPAYHLYEIQFSLLSTYTNWRHFFCRFNLWSPSRTPWCLSFTTAVTRKALHTQSWATHSFLWSCSWISTDTPTTSRRDWQNIHHHHHHPPSNQTEPCQAVNKSRTDLSWSVKTESSTMKIRKERK